MAISAMGNDVAAEAAGLSGGESLDFADKHSFENDIGILSNHIANRYTLSFRQRPISRVFIRSAYRLRDIPR